MKILVALCAIVAVSTANVIIIATDHHGNILGRNECTWGPSYWCENIKNAAKCKTTRHCISTSWKDMKVPEDNDSVCNICKNMVEEARDQLESNQTQQDLKDVFEGSCKLMHIEPVVNECIKIVDEYIPELVETLSSQMNPSVVCTVAGLCNSAHIDKLLHQYGESMTKIDEVKSRSLEKDELEPDECSKCYTVATHMEFKLNNTPNDGLLRQMLNSCAYLGTFSDACSAIVLTHFELIRLHLQENFNAQNICHLSGQCSDRFHVHEDANVGVNVEVKPLSSVGVVDVNDDLPCKLCEQLVGHLRDLLVANTTEAEFEDVMRGFCKQMKSFADECTAIVEEYYPQMYEYLTKSLNSNIICQMGGLCPAPGKQLQNEQIWPLVPKNAAEIGMRIFQEAKKNLENEKQMELSKSEVEAMQLPIERLMPFPISQGGLGVEGKESCAFCEYVLHYIQEAITDPVTEDKVKQAIERVCKELPETVQGECSEFVDNYGSALVAILAQKIDPSQVCPMLHVCPSAELMHIWESVPAKYVLTEKQKKPNCPLCLLAVSQIYNVIKNNKTEASIQSALDKLCSHLSPSLTDECKDLVKGYSKELVEMLLADLTPEEVCSYLKLCDDTENFGPKNVISSIEDAQILTNEIPGARESDEESKISLNPLDYVCDLLLEKVAKRLDNDENRASIEHKLHEGCNHLGKFSGKCNKLVNKHSKQIINYLLQDVAPSAICSLLSLRKLDEDLAMIEEGISPQSECSLCQHALHYVQNIVSDPITENKAKQAIDSLCTKLPNSMKTECSDFVRGRGDSIVKELTQVIDPQEVCLILHLCPSTKLVTSQVTVLTKYMSGKRNEEKPSCPLCMMAVRKLYRIIEDNKTEANIEMELNKLCSHLPRKWKTECSDLVKTYSRELVELLLADLTPEEVCSYIKLCDDAQDASLKNMFNSNEDGQIWTTEILSSIESYEESRISLNSLDSVCDLLLQEVTKRLDNDISRDNIERKVYEGCNHVEKFSGKCNKLVNKHGKQIVHYLLQDVAPSAICSLLSLRNFNENLVPAILRDDSMQSDEESRISLDPFKHACKFLLKKVDKRLVSNKKEDEAVSEVHKGCKHLGKLSGECDKLVNKHGKQIVHYLVQDVAPSAICSLLKLRSLDEDLAPAVLWDGRMQSDEESQISLDPLKHACKFLLKKVDKRLVSNKKEDEAVSEVHKGCKHLGKLSGECDKLVNKHGKQIVHYLVQDIAPSAICSLLKLRSLDEDLAPAVLWDGRMQSDEESQISLDPLKHACKFLLKKVDKRLVSNKKEDEAVSEVHKGCKHLGKLSGECDKLVNKHGKQIVHFLVQDVAPSAICSLLKLRSLDEDLAPAVLWDGRMQSDEESQISLDPLKHACKFLLKKVDKRLVSNKKEDEAVSEVHKGCKHLGKLSGECDKLVNKHGKQIVHYLVQDIAPSAICSLLKLRSLDEDLAPAVLWDGRMQSDEESQISLDPLKHACKFLLKKVDKRLVSNKKEDEAVSEVHKGCKHLGKLSGECDKLVNKHGKQIVHYLVQDIAPSAICSLLKLRSLDEDLAPAVLWDGRMQSDEESQISLDPLKHACKFLLKKVDKRLVSNKKEDEAVSEVHKGCKHLGKLSGECDKLVNKHGKQIVHFLVQDVAPSAICSLLKLRSLDEDLAPAVLWDGRMQSDEESQISLDPLKHACKFLLKKVDKRLVSNKKEDEAVSEVHKGCKHLGKLSGECDKLVNKHGKQIVHYLVQDIAPSAICSLLKLRSLDEDLAPAVLWDGRMQSDEESQISLDPLKHACKFLLKKVDKRLVSNKKEDEAVSEVHKGCKHLGKLSGECDKLVNKHGKQIVHYLVQDIAPSAICSLLKLRSLDEDLAPAVLWDGRMQSDEESQISLDPLKHACKFLLKKVDKRLVSNKKEDEAVSEVHKGCKHLGKLSGECDKLVNKHGKQIVHFLVQDVAPSAICSLLKLRSLDEDLAPAVLWDGRMQSDEESQISLDPLKHACKFLLKKVDKRLVSNKKEDEAVSEVHKGCKHLGKLSGECDKLVNKHGKQIVHYLVQDIAPSAICSLLKLRSLDEDLAPAVLWDGRMQSDEESQISLDPLKHACKFLLKKVDKRLVSNKKEDEAVSEVHKGCKHLGKLSGECDKLVNKHGKQIVHYLVQDIAPSAICSLLKLRSLDEDLAPAVLWDGRMQSDEESQISLDPLKHACKFLLKKVDKRLVSNKKEDEAVSEVHKGCKHLGKLSGECDKLVNKHGKQIVHFLVQDVAPSAICSLLKLRSLDEDLAPAVLWDGRMQSDEESQISLDPLKHACKFLLKKVDKRLVSNKKEDEAVSEVHKGCKHLGKLSGECDKLVNKHGKQIVHYLVQDIAPSAICSLLKLRSLDEDLAPAVLWDGRMQSDEESQISLDPLKHACKFLLKKVDKRLVSNKKEDEAVSEVHKGCKHLGKLSGECDKLVNKHGKQIVHFLVQDVAPSAICSLLKLRSLDEDLAPAVLWDGRMQSDEESQISLDPLKHACKFLLKKVDKRLVSNKKEDEAVSEVHKGCKHLGKLSGECDKLVNKHGKQIVHFLVQDVAPSAICSLLKLRSLDEDLAPAVLWDGRMQSDEESQISLDPLKHACKFLLKKVDKRLVSNKKEDEAVSEVHKGCKHLGKLSGECDKLVNKHGKQIVHYLVQDIAPSAICSLLKLRSLDEDLAPAVLWDGRMQSDEESQISLDPLKHACKFLLKKVDKRLVSNKKEDEAVSEVHKGCKHLGKLSGECDKLVNKHGKQIVHFLVQDVAPSAICSLLKLRSLDEDLAPAVLWDGRMQSDEESQISLDPLKHACKFLLKKVDKRLVSNKKEDEAVSEVHKGCKHLGKLSGECDKLVNKHGKQIVHYLVQDIAPSAICSLLKLRSLDEDLAPAVLWDGRMQSDEESQISLDPLKHACKFLLKKVDKRLVSNKKEDEAVSEVHKGCKHLGKLSGECDKLVNKHGKQIVHYLVQDIAPSAICSLLKLRSLDEDLAPAVLWDGRMQSDEESQISLDPLKHACKFLLKKVDKRLVSNKKEDEAVSEVHKGCKHLGKLSGECDKLVNKHGKQIVHFLVQDVAPSAICSLLKLRSLDEDLAPAVLWDGRMQSDEESQISLDPLKHACKFLLKKVDKRLVSNKKEDEAVSEVHKGCKHLGKLSGECDKLVNKHGKQIVHYLVQDIAPSAICSLLKLRSLDEDLAPAVLWDGRMQSDEESQISLDPLKHACKFLLKKVDKRLVSNKKEDEAVSEVHKGCKHLGKLSGECDKLVNKHGKQIVHYLVQDIAPSAICSLLKLRSLDEDLAPAVLWDGRMQSDEESQISLDPLKHACKFLLKKVDKRLVSNKKEDEAVSEVHKGCKHLGKLSGECDKLVNKHGKQIVHYLVQDVAPSTICSLLKLRSLDEDLIPATLNASATECAVCDAFMSAVHYRLGNSAVAESIEKAVLKACNYVPGRYQSKCTLLVQSRGPVVVNLIKQRVNPAKICSRIHLCGSNDRLMVSLENSRIKRSYEKDPTRRCTWGSDYWCSTDATAIECKAVEHCRNNVWKSSVAPVK